MLSSAQGRAAAWKYPERGRGSADGAVQCDHGDRDRRTDQGVWRDGSKYSHAIEAQKSRVPTLHALRNGCSIHLLDIGKQGETSNEKDDNRGFDRSHGNKRRRL